jgi:hypothetical protein
LGQESSQHSARPRRGDPLPSYVEGSDEEEEIEEEGTESDDDELEDDTYEQPPPSLHAAMERGLLKRNPITNLVPKRATKPPTSIKAN